ncbi:hypothetical protein E5288_WYG022799 [Bos mutus]|uniref:Uncharacterized protein n=1 Tax=Bos mutus TaxID=72004 RepID=A0A6B0R664_9CETA|nr:hypothetical protein [Bos mutus]
MPKNENWGSECTGSVEMLYEIGQGDDVSANRDMAGTFQSKSPHSQKHTHQASEDGSSGREKPVTAMDEKPHRQKLPPLKELGRLVVASATWSPAKYPDITHLILIKSHFTQEALLDPPGPGNPYIGSPLLPSLLLQVKVGTPRRQGGHPVPGTILPAGAEDIESPRIHPEAPAALKMGGEEACIPEGTHTTPVGPWVPALPNWAWVQQSPKSEGPPGSLSPTPDWFLGQKLPNPSSCSPASGILREVFYSPDHTGPPGDPEPQRGPIKSSEEKKDWREDKESQQGPTACALGDLLANKMARVSKRSRRGTFPWEKSLFYLTVLQLGLDNVKANYSLEGGKGIATEGE